MYQWWTMVNMNGYPQKVYCTASNAFEATNIFKALYGSTLICEHANMC